MMSNPITDPARLLSAPPAPLLLSAWAGSGKRIVAAERHIAHVPTALRRPRVLVACEFSGIVRDAFIVRGFDAWSCDILPTEQRGPHIINDVRNVLDDGWDLMIAFPPCTYLSYAGARWWKQPGRMDKAHQAMDFFLALWNAPIPMIAIENPHGLTWKWFRKPDQIIEPYHFGHPMTKATGLWLKQLPPLIYTLIHASPFVNWTGKGNHAHNGKSRSRTFNGIASAMAQQWGHFTP